MSYDASDRTHVRLAEKAAKRAERERGVFIASLMSTATGRAWMLELLEACHIFTTSHSSSALNTAFAEGERNIGLRLLNQIMDACPDDYVLMMKERNVKEVVEDGRRNPYNTRPGGITPIGSDGKPIVEPTDDA